MKCLSIKQPFAALIVAGVKIYENRTWATSYRGPLLIHAGKSRDMLTVTLPDPLPADMAFGAIIGRVDLVDCLAIEDTPVDPYAFGPFCFVLENPVAFEPVPFAGKLGLFDVNFDPLLFRPLPSAR